MPDPHTSMGGSPAFPQTTWGMLQHLHGEHRQLGLEALCARYWKPIYAYLRRAFAKTNEDAKDLTQAFFLWLNDADVLDRYDPAQVPFRAFLKTLLTNYARNHERAQRALKRGGGHTLLPLGHEPPDSRELDPERAFDRAWIEDLIEAATAHIRETCHTQGHSLRYAVFAAYDLCDGPKPTYDELARRFDLPKHTVRNHLFAVRELLRNELRRALGASVTSDAQLDQEWRALFLNHP